MSALVQTIMTIYICNTKRLISLNNRGKFRSRAYIMTDFKLGDLPLPPFLGPKRQKRQAVLFIKFSLR